VKGSNDPWRLTVAVVERCKKDNPHYTELFILQTCRDLVRWCIDNPGKQKTRSGMPRFVSRNVGNDITASKWSRSSSNGPRASNDRFAQNLSDAAEAILKMNQSADEGEQTNQEWKGAT
jgi:hypothetical protein